MKKFPAAVPLLASLALLAGAARAAEVTVFAAASLADALQAMATPYEKAHPGVKLRFNFGASSTLARQIGEGAPADVFFSADEAKMDDLARAGLIVSATRRSLLSNALVIVVPAGKNAAWTSPAELAGAAIRRVVLAETRTVPAGIYASAWLRSAGLWDRIADKIVPTENVRACLAAVESGNADAGIVYRTDAMISQRVKVAFTVPEAAGPRISYPVAVVQRAGGAAEAPAWVAYLASAEAAAVFRSFGFRPAP